MNKYSVEITNGKKKTIKPEKQYTEMILHGKVLKAKEKGVWKIGEAIWTLQWRM